MIRCFFSEEGLEELEVEEERLEEQFGKRRGVVLNGDFWVAIEAEEVGEDLGEGLAIACTS
jgi:hypothetical protein